MSKQILPKPKPKAIDIFIYHVGIAEEILGPGKRVIIWMSGCPFNCEGCIEPLLHDIKVGTPWKVVEFVNQINPILDELKRVTISGGEPFFQSAALLSLLQLMDHRYDTMVFSGYRGDYLKSQYPAILPYIDIMVTEEFDQEKQGNFLWRGSANQHILSPSARYNDLVLETWESQPSAGIEVIFEKKEMFIYGIPPKGILEELYHNLHRNSIKVELD